MTDDDFLSFDEPEAETKKRKPRKKAAQKPTTPKSKGKQTMSKAKTETTTKRVTAKSLIRDLIVSDKTDEFIIKDVKKKLPDSNIDEKHCTKYRRELFNEGAIKADKAARGSAEHREWAKDNLAVAKKGPHKAHWVQWDKDQKQKVKDEAAAKKAAAAAKKAA